MLMPEGAGLGLKFWDVFKLWVWIVWSGVIGFAV